MLTIKQVFNIAAAMCKQAGRVQLEQSDLRLAINTIDKAINGLTWTNCQETVNIIRKPRAELREEKRKGITFEGHKSVKAVLGTHPAMVYENQGRGCLVCQDGIAHNPDTRWKRRGTRQPAVARTAFKKTAFPSSSTAVRRHGSKTARKQPADQDSAVSAPPEASGNSEYAHPTARKTVRKAAATETVAESPADS